MKVPATRLAILTVVGLLISSCSSGHEVSGPGDGSPTDGVDAVNSSHSSFRRDDLGTLGGASSYASDINSNSVVVGWSETAAGTTHAFRWSATDGMRDLGALPGDRLSRAIAILDGTGVGGAEILGVSGDEGRWTPVTWSASGTISALSIPLLPNFTLALPTGINSRGDIVGSDAGSPGQHGWVWSATGEKYDLSANVQGGSNEGSAGAVTGSGLVLLTTRALTCKHATECWRTYLWSTNQGYVSLGTPGADAEVDVTGLALNETGAVVGWTKLDGQAATNPYRWTAETGFKFLPNYSKDVLSYGYAMAVDPPGAAVGADLETSSGSIVATMWPATGGIVRLSPSDPSPSVAVAINSSNRIVGWTAVADGVNHAVVWSPSVSSSSAMMGAAAPLRRNLTASTPCLENARSIKSRQALFTCVAKADIAR